VDGEIFHLYRPRVTILYEFLFYMVGGLAAGFRSCQAVGVSFYDFIG
jgi:hypothetical protein